ncbi:hypothetical protein FMEXI_12601 [Fusarium mexicanum]|uniref:F-box domain-containing protein n=1 Tax=Fusarium mexicanum TaxID=751941 RepID=A0A8H5I7R8_9HYPO|nr:hypothetical protein FMEXI_12601 [Fusarium mexicanum]
MTKVVTVLMTLLGTAFAQIDRTCIDIAFNSETNTLSGKCQPRDNSGYIPSELDLNDCFGYDGTTITSEKVAVPIEAAVAHDVSSDKNPDQNPESLSSVPETSQKSQPVTLDLLPTEVLLQISGEPGKDQDTISAEEFKSLCLLSPPLSQVYLKFYYLGDSCGAFRQAVRSANIKAMDRCAQFGAAPDTTWELPESDGCKCISERRHIHHRPIDELLESVYLGKVPIENAMNALRWLLERRFDMKEQKDQAWYEANTHCDHFPDFLITMLSKSPDHVYTEGICQMIKLIQSYGYSLPFAMNLDTYWHLDERERLSPGLIRKPLDEALRSHCPPYLLEVIMQDYIRRRVDFSSTHVVPPAFMESWAGKHKFAYEYTSDSEVFIQDQQWWKFTNLLETTWGIFLDLVDPSTNWAEQYRGEASDILEQKIKILAKYGILNEIEEEMLGSIVEAMRSMTTPTKTSSITGVTDWDAQCCWDTFVKTLRPFTAIWEVHTVDNWTAGEADADTWGDAHRYHRFIIDREWDPYQMYHNYQLQNDQIRPTINRPWGSRGIAKGNDGRWVDREWTRVVRLQYLLPSQVKWLEGTCINHPVRTIDHWRLPKWDLGLSYGEIEKIVSERWTKLFLAGSIAPQSP